MAEENLKNSHIYWNETIYSGRTKGPKKSKGKSENKINKPRHTKMHGMQQKPCEECL